MELVADKEGYTAQSGWLNPRETLLWQFAEEKEKEAPEVSSASKDAKIEHRIRTCESKLSHRWGLELRP